MKDGHHLRVVGGLREGEERLDCSKGEVRETERVTEKDSKLQQLAGGW